MASKELSAGMMFEILGFASTINKIGQIHAGLFMIKQAATGATNAVMAITKTFALATAAGKFEEGLVSIQQRSGATRLELEALRIAAIDAGLKTQFSPQQAVDGLLELAGMGFKARESISLLTPVLDLAAGSLGQLGLADAALAVAGTMRSFRMETSDATVITDKLLRITQLTNFQARDFGTGLSKAAGEAGQFGQSLNDTLILMGLLRNMNLNASVSSTAVRNAMRRLAGDQRVQNIVNKEGVDIYDKLTGKMRPVLDIIGDLAAKTEKMSAKQKDLLSFKVFGARGIFSAGAFEGARFSKTLADGSIQILKGKEAIAAYRIELDKSNGAAKRFREALLGTFEGQKKLMTGIIQTAAVLAGEPLVKVLKPIIRLLVDFANQAVAIFRSLPEPIKNFAAVVFVATSAFAVFAVAVIGFKILMASLIFVMNGVGISLLGIVGTALSLVAMFAALAAAAVGLYYAFKTNFGGVTDLFNKVKSAVIGTWAVFTAWKDGTSSLSKEVAASLEKSGVLDFAIRLGGFIGRTKDAMISMWSAAKQMSTPLADALTPLGKALMTLFGAIGSVGVAISESLFGPFEKMKGTKQDITSSFFKIFNVVVSVVGWVSNVVAGALNFISSALKTMIQPGFMTGIFSKVVGFFQGIWAVLQPIIATFVTFAANLLPAVFTIVSGIWDVFSGIAQVIGGIVLGLFGGLDLISGGGGFLPVLHLVGNVFTIIFQIVAAVFRVIAWIANVLLQVVAPIAFAIAGVFGIIFGVIVSIGKFITGYLVSAFNVVLVYVNAMLAPFKWIIEKIEKFNPFGGKGTKNVVEQQASTTMGVSTLANNNANAILEKLGLGKAATPGASQAQRSGMAMPIMPENGSLAMMQAQAQTANAGQDDRANREQLERLNANEAEKKRLMQRQAVASESLVNMLNSPTDIVPFLIEALAAAQLKAKTDSYGNG